MTMPNDTDLMRGMGLTYAAVHGFLCGDVEAAGRAICDLTDMGQGFLFSACGVWAAMVNEGIQPAECACCKEQADDDGEYETFVGMEFIDARTGEHVNPDDAPPEARPAVWAARFVTASANSDPHAMHALFKAGTDEPELLGRGVLQLAKMAAAAVEHARSRA